jgi:predicted phosphodiesterase
MRFVAISDTHGQHQKLQLPAGDVLLHAGDVSRRGTAAEVAEFMQWMASQPYAHKIFIAGNHDFFFEKTDPEVIQQLIPPGVTYLSDSGTQIADIPIWGSPISPWFYDWAFNRHRGAAIARHWALIPHQTQVLITHGPVWGILDATNSGHRASCEELHKTISRLSLKAHICGHIHEGYGHVSQQGMQFFNASVLNVQYQMVNPPLVFDL